MTITSSTYPEAQVLAVELKHAVTLHKQGQLAEAIRIYQKILSRFPEHSDSNHFLGMAFYKAGNTDAAIQQIKQAIALDANNYLYHLNLGRIYLNTENYDSALSYFKNAISLNSSNSDIHHLLGRCLRMMGDFAAAVISLHTSVELNPNNFQMKFDLALALAGLKQHAKAVDIYQDLIRQDPNRVDVMRSLSFSLRALNQNEEAKRIILNALDHNSSCARTWCEYGEIMEELGSFAESDKAFRKALTIQDGFPLAASHLLARKGASNNGNLVLEAERHLKEQRITKPIRVKLHFSLGKHFDSLKQYGAAFDHFQAANNLISQSHPYNPEDSENHIDQLTTSFSAELFARLAQRGSSSCRPIFIVGMPRSGTTLTEQILASHHAVSGAGELGFFNFMDKKLAQGCEEKAQRYEYLESLQREDLLSWSEEYLAFLDKMSEPSMFTIDKMPLNFLHLGLIACTFPNAHIIHCQRDPLDNCLSIFQENFHESQNYSTDLAHLAHYYNQYSRLMKHWHTVLPIRIFDIQYETLVNDFEPRAKSLLEFCGLDWDDNCTKFYATQRAVSTPSMWQVRQPIYNSSIGKWRNYAEYLEPLRIALKTNCIGH